MQVLSLDLFLCKDGDTVQASELRDMEEDLKSIELSILNGIAAEV